MDSLPDERVAQVLVHSLPPRRLALRLVTRAFCRLLRDDAFKIKETRRLIAVLAQVRAAAVDTFGFHATEWSAPLIRKPASSSFDVIRMADILLDETTHTLRPVTDALFPFWWHALHVSDALVFAPGFECACCGDRGLIIPYTSDRTRAPRHGPCLHCKTWAVLHRSR